MLQIRRQEGMSSESQAPSASSLLSLVPSGKTTTSCSPTGTGDQVAPNDAEYAVAQGNSGSVLRDDRSGQAVRRGDRGLPDHPVVIRVVVDEHPEDRAEVLGGEDLVARVRALDDRRPHEEALRVVRRPAGDDGERAQNHSSTSGQLSSHSQVSAVPSCVSG